MTEKEPQPVRHELTEAQFKLRLNRAVKSRGEDDEVLEIANQFMKDIKRYKEAGLRVRYYSQDGSLWIEPEDKGEIGFKT